MNDAKDDKASTEQEAPTEPSGVPETQDASQRQREASSRSPAAAEPTEPSQAEAPGHTPAEDAAPSRRQIRRSARVDVPEEASVPAPAPTTEAAEEAPAKKRRRRRRRTKPTRATDEAQTEAAEAAPSTPSPAEPEAPRTRKPRARRRVKPPAEPPPEKPAPRREAKPARRGSKPPGAGSPAQRRPDAMPKERRPDTKPRPEATPPATRTAKPAAVRDAAPKPSRETAPRAPQKPGKGEDMITLILHPQPKAAPSRRRKSGRPMTAKEALQAKAAKRSPGKRAKTAGEPARRSDEAEQAGAGPVELREEWLKAGAAAAHSCLEEAGAGAPQLIRAWQKVANADAIAAVAYQQAGGGAEPVPGALRKAARRALSALKSRGVAVPEKPTDTAAPAHQRPGAEREPEPLVATFVPPDTNGMTFFSISQRLAGGRYQVADVVIRDELGIMHASSGKLAGKQIRRWRQRVESRLGTAPVSVPLEWARYRISKARKQNDTSGQVLPLGLDSCASLFEPAPEAEPEHPLADLEREFDEAEVAAAAADSEQLHNEPEFRTWLPERRSLDEMLRNVGTRVGAEGAEDQELVDKVLGEEMESATDRHFAPEVRTALADRMRDAAISIRERADDTAARRVLGVAQAVREAGLITSPPSQIPFLIGFFRKAIAMMAQQGEGKLRVPIHGAPPAAAEAPAAEDTSAPPATK